MVAVRQAGPGDAAVVAALVARLLSALRGQPVDAGPLAAPAGHWLGEPERFVAFLAHADADAGGESEAIGVLTLSTGVSLYARGPFGVIAELYVEPAHRSSGVGAALLERARAHGRARGWDRIEVGAPDASAWARTVAFYRGNGFSEIGPRLVTVL